MGRPRKTGPERDAAAAFARRFGLNLATQRLAAGISQEELGTLAVLHRTAVGQLELGERVPRADTVVKLSGALQVEPQALLVGLIWVPPTIAINPGRWENDSGGTIAIEQPTRSGA